MSFDKTVIALCGPTAAGKTDLAIQQALQFGTEIISADSRQCFTELNIGVAKPSSGQLKEVKHYFINSHSIRDQVNAGVFEKYALETLSQLFKQKDFVVVAGGTGLYVKALLEGIDDIPEIEAAIELEVREQFSSFGLDWLTEQIRQEDPLFFQKGEMKNPHRMMRALAVVRSTKKSILEFHSSIKPGRNFHVRKIFLDPPREILYSRIDNRVDEMMDAGLLDEVRSLYDQKDLNALQTVGYKELFDHLENHISLEKAVELIKRNTRHYAKRQLTWFKKYFVDDDTEVIR